MRPFIRRSRFTRMNILVSKYNYYFSHWLLTIVEDLLAFEGNKCSEAFM